MVRLWSLVLVFVLAFSVVACGEDEADDVDDTPAGPLTAETARTCDQMMTVILEVFQGMLDKAAVSSMEEIAAGTWADEFDEPATANDDRWEELGCTEDDFADLFSSRVDELSAEGEIAEVILESWIEAFEDWGQD